MEVKEVAEVFQKPLKWCLKAVSHQEIEKKLWQITIKTLSHFFKVPKKKLLQNRKIRFCGSFSKTFKMESKDHNSLRN